MASNIKKMKSYLQNNSIVKIYYFNEEFHGHVLMDSKKFLLIREIFDFTYQGLIIFNKKYIKKIKYGTQEKFDETLMSKYIKKPNEYIDWLKMDSYKMLLGSLQNNYNEICIELVGKKDVFLVGNIIKLDKKHLYMRTLDTKAKYDKQINKLKIKNIAKIIFDDPYSKLLFRYNRDFVK